MNNINLFGRLTAEPELKTARENKFVKFCVAVDRRTKDRQTDFIDCIAWNQLAEIISKYCHKGNLISITGSLQTSTYEKNGEKRKSFDVCVTSVDLVGETQKPAQETPAPEPAPAPEEYGVPADDLPFSI